MTIVIIGLLAALLLGVISQAKRKAKSVQCVSNMRQIYSAMAQAGSDGTGQFAITPGNWMAATRPYLGIDSQAYLCPEDAAPSSPSPGSGYTVRNGNPLNEGMHTALTFGPTPWSITATNDPQMGYFLPVLSNGPKLIGFELSYAQNFNSIGWGDQYIRVTEDSNGDVVVEMLASTRVGDVAIIYNMMTDPPTHAYTFPQPNCRDPRSPCGETKVFPGVGGTTSYAMNAALSRNALSAPGRILLLDFEEETIAWVAGNRYRLPGQWEANHAPRHPGQRMNVMDTSGAVLSKTAAEIDPNVPVNSQQFWNLPSEPQPY